MINAFPFDLISSDYSTYNRACVLVSGILPATGPSPAQGFKGHRLNS